MKRLGIIMLAAWISAALLAGCEKHVADAPDFPLEKQAIEEALETMGLQYTVEEDSKLREILPGFTSFNLYSEEGKFLYRRYKKRRKRRGEDVVAGIANHGGNERAGRGRQKYGGFGDPVIWGL